MATVAARLPRERSLRVKPAWIVATLAVTAAGLYMAMRVPTAIEMQRKLFGWCADLEMRPGDWYCEVTATSAIAAVVPSALLVGLGLALPCAVLVAAGRRVAAFVPLLVPAAYIAGLTVVNEVLDDGARADQSLLGIWDTIIGNPGRDTFWTSRPTLAAMLDAVLIGAPVLAGAVFAWRIDRSRAVVRRRPPVGAAAAWLSIGVVVAVIALLTVIWNRLGTSGDMRTYLQREDEWVVMLVMASFGVLLGTDRRFSPWIFAPVALLLSAAVPIALTGTLYNMTAFFGFGAVAPIASVGLAASAWRPLAETFGRARARRRSATDDHAGVAVLAGMPATTERPRVRRIVVANALAAGLIAMSLLAARFDPLPIQISAPLPTYRGAWHLEADIEKRTELRGALDAMNAHYADQGTYRGSTSSRRRAAAGSTARSPTPTATSNRTTAASR